MLHFTDREFALRMARLESEISRRGLDGMLLFAPESQYWLTGYDSFGYCFFQCLIVGGSEPVLLTRSADLRQARLTSNIRDIRLWVDGEDVDPTASLWTILQTLELAGKRLGIETDTQGLTALYGQRLYTRLEGRIELIESSDLVSALRLIKSEAELVYVHKAAKLADDALDTALDLAGAGVDEAQILGAMQNIILSGGGDYPANEFIIGSSDHALLCRYNAGRRTLSRNDQLTLEWAGVYRHYHVALMRTLIIGEPGRCHDRLHEAALKALQHCEIELQPGQEMARVYDAHVTTLDQLGLGAHRLNACGYALGARFSPSWMERQMFYKNATTMIQPGMVFFLHMILMDSDTNTAMCLGRSYLITDNGNQSLSRHGLEMLRC